MILDKFGFSLNNSKLLINAETEKLSPKDKAAKEQEAAGESEAEEDNGDHIIVKPIVPLPDKVVNIKSLLQLYFKNKKSNIICCLFTGVFFLGG